MIKSLKFNNLINLKHNNNSILYLSINFSKLRVETIPSKSSRKIITNHNHNLSKIHSIIKSLNPEVLVLESENASLNLKTNSIAYKLVMDNNWIGIETRHTRRNRDNNRKLLRITLINHQFIDRYRWRREDAEVI